LHKHTIILGRIENQLETVIDSQKQVLENSDSSLQEHEQMLQQIQSEVSAVAGMQEKSSLALEGIYQTMTRWDNIMQAVLLEEATERHQPRLCVHSVVPPSIISGTGTGWQSHSTIDLHSGPAIQIYNDEDVFLCIGIDLGTT
jgi:hypothetical protein